MESSRSLVLIDDHAVVRQAMASLVEAIGPYTVTAQFSNGRELLDALPLAPHPDLLILDLIMPQMNGRETMRHLSARGYQYPVLVLSNEVDAGNVLELIRLGARGYLSKACSAKELATALQSILEEGYYHSELEKSVLDGTARVKSATTFTPREMEFLRLAVSPEEYTYRTIADIMGVSQRTVDGYREEVFRKTGAKTKTGLAFYALKHALVQLPAA